MTRYCITMQRKGYAMGEDTRLRVLRERRGVSVRQAAGELGVTGQFLSQVELGNRGPSLDLLVRMAEYYEVSTDFLLGVSDDPNPVISEKAANVFDSLPAGRQVDALALWMALRLVDDPEFRKRLLTSSFDLNSFGGAELVEAVEGWIATAEEDQRLEED